MTQEWHFANWLNEQIEAAGLYALTVANRLGVSYQLVRRHLAGQKPFFKDIVCYCWLFHIPDQVEDIWQKVREEYEL